MNITVKLRILISTVRDLEFVDADCILHVISALPEMLTYLLLQCPLDK